MPNLHVIKVQGFMPHKCNLLRGAGTLEAVLRPAPPRPASLRPAPDGCLEEVGLGLGELVGRVAGQAVPQASPAGGCKPIVAWRHGCPASSSGMGRILNLNAVSPTSSDPWQLPTKFAPVVFPINRGCALRSPGHSSQSWQWVCRGARSSRSSFPAPARGAHCPDCCRSAAVDAV